MTRCRSKFGKIEKEEVSLIGKDGLSVEDYAAKHTATSASASLLEAASASKVEVIVTFLGNTGADEGRKD